MSLKSAKNLIKMGHNCKFLITKKSVSSGPNGKGGAGVYETVKKNEPKLLEWLRIGSQ